MPVVSSLFCLLGISETFPSTSSRKQQQQQRPPGRTFEVSMCLRVLRGEDRKDLPLGLPPSSAGLGFGRLSWRSAQGLQELSPLDSHGDARLGRDLGRLYAMRLFTYDLSTISTGLAIKRLHTNEWILSGSSSLAISSLPRFECEQDDGCSGCKSVCDSDSRHRYTRLVRAEWKRHGAFASKRWKLGAMVVCRLKIDEGREPARQLGTAGVSNHLEHSQHRMHLSSFISARADHDRHRGSSGWAPLNRTPSSDDHMLDFLPHECPEIKYPSSIFKIITDYHLGYRSGKSLLPVIDVTHEWILGVSTQGDASNTCEIELPGLAVNRQTHQFASVSLPLGTQYSGWAWKATRSLIRTDAGPIGKKPIRPESSPPNESVSHNNP